MSPHHHAEQLARDLLADPLPRRWAHTQGVAATARTLSGIVGEHTELLVAAAWLHEFGYSPALARAGFHPIDGARHLRHHTRACEMLCRLVAHHSCALAGAAELGLAEDLVREFPPPPRHLADALTYCDMTTGPDGQRLPVAQRLAEILGRYGPAHPVSRAITASAPELTAAVTRVTRMLTTPPRRQRPRSAALWPRAWLFSSS